MRAFLLLFLLFPVLELFVFVKVSAAIGFFPALLLCSNKLIGKTKHRRLTPTFQNIGKGISKIRIPVFCHFLERTGFYNHRSISTYPADSCQIFLQRL